MVTYDGQPGLDQSDRLLQLELEAMDLSVRACSWSDKSVDWSASTLTVLRSTWDSHRRHEQFRAWVGATSSRTILLNPPDTINWNFDKRYLSDLESRGVPIIPSRYYEAGPGTPLERLDIPWDDVVIKPAIGGSSYGVQKYHVASELPAITRSLADMRRTTGVLLQRFEPSVSTAAERSLIFIDDAYTHAVRREPFNTGNTPDSADFDHAPSGEEIDFGARVLQAARAGSLPFARVDLLPSADGLLLMELELIDPSLFLTRNPKAAQRLAAALYRRL
ncbi:MAG: hypothetical protein M3O06_04050 [Pseudomonadota bacterium]|nr:hypothetical protein [Pseudomonadota bacterium]